MIVPAVAVLTGLAVAAWLFGDVRSLDAGGSLATAAPTISVVIPARNEERSLPRLLASLAAQTAPPHEVLVVDDGSTDATAVVARAAGAHVITAPAPPAGWLGKPWACATGADAATGQVLVFLDADTVLAPSAMAELVATHARHPDGLLSVQPRHEVDRPVEQLSAFPNLAALLASGAFRRGSGGVTEVAFGPCLITSAEAYGRVGGHASVAGEVVEDIHLARRYRALGLPVHARAGGASVRFRMYPAGWPALRDGWTKNLATGAFLAPRRFALATTAWVAATATVAWGLVAGLGRPTAPWWAVGWAATAGQLGWMLRRIGSFRPWVAVLYPVPLAAFTYLVLRSAVVRAAGGRVPWRGRPVPVR
jgi:hypothetical protein